MTRLAWGLALLTASLGTSLGSGPRLSDVYVAGEGGYQSYRIPSVIATRKGTLLAFAEGRRTGAGDAGDIDLVLRMTSAKTHGRNRLLFANPASARRERMTVRLSYDEGKSWPVARVLHEGPAAYSSLVVLGDLSVGLLFERGDRSPYERITFARLTLGWLTEGKDR